MSKNSPKKRVYTIPGDTINERKRAAQKFLGSLGCTIDLGRITQKKGVISIRWEPPFPEQLLKKMETVAKYAAVFFGPDSEAAKLAYIDVVFERAPGLFMDYPVFQQYIILDSLDILQERLSNYYQMVCKHRAAMEEIARKTGATPEPDLEPEQLSLWE
ncbi:MAG: hypothetical protein J2P36_17515 [Ktedonobacteraceae bacterium]|nr:hypothetical protein [Ktedonobacteraceae bacterium]